MMQPAFGALITAAEVSAVWIVSGFRHHVCHGLQVGIDDLRKQVKDLGLLTLRLNLQRLKLLVFKREFNL
jgi:hypothetical protein